jgi:DNA-binding MarR family transcriptional regulator
MKPRAPRTGPRYQALLQLLHTADTVWNASRLFFDRWNLSPSQFNVLNLLFGEANGLSQIELGRRLLMHRSNVTGLVDRLEIRDLLERRDNDNDRRAFRVVLTPAGQKLLEEIYPHYLEAAERVWDGIPLSRVSELAAQFQVICDNATRLADKTKS